MQPFPPYQASLLSRGRVKCPALLTVHFRSQRTVITVLCVVTLGTGLNQATGKQESVSAVGQPEAALQLQSHSVTPHNQQHSKQTWKKKSQALL